MSDLISTEEAVVKIVNTAIRKILSSEQKLTKEYEQSVKEAVNVVLNTTRRTAQPEIKPIDYQDCANAMLRMWMDKVVTDGEYNRIMDKLNAFWGTRNERSD